MKKQYQQYREHLLEELGRGGGGGATSAPGGAHAFGHFAPLEAGTRESEKRLAARRASLLAVLLGSAILGAFICYLVRACNTSPKHSRGSQKGCHVVGGVLPGTAVVTSFTATHVMGSLLEPGGAAGVGAGGAAGHFRPF